MRELAAIDAGAAREDGLIYLGMGPLLAIVLGYALIPFREVISASNLSFVFVVLTVLVSAFGGRSAGVATALVSSLSMDFFLTKPYLSLRIYENHDLVAFAGLTLCGLVAASLGSPQRIAALREARAHLHVLQEALVGLEAGGPVEVELSRVLDRARHGLPVRALVVRELGDRVVAATSPRQSTLEPIPNQVLEEDTLLPRGRTEGISRRPPPLPPEGARVALSTHNHQVGWLDLWGDGAPATAASRRTLSGVARVAGVMLGRAAGR